MVVRIWDGGEERVWCLACLRGRLLAERQASREAKEAAESMGNKLVDLEKLVKEEIELRDKAERKLKFLKKKLESFNKSRQLDHSDSPEKCEKSCGSSSITSISKYSETSETKHAAKNSPLPEDDDVVHNHNTPSSTTKDSDSQITNSFSTNIIYSFTFQQKSRVASGARIKSLADKSIKEQHFTSRNFLEAVSNQHA